MEATPSARTRKQVALTDPSRRRGATWIKRAVGGRRVRTWGRVDGEWKLPGNQGGASGRGARGDVTLGSEEGECASRSEEGWKSLRLWTVVASLLQLKP